MKVFNVPAGWRRPLYISFQGVESAFYVWLNGEFVGYSEDSFTPSDFDLTPYLTEGENKLAVEVYQRAPEAGWRIRILAFSGIFAMCICTRYLTFMCRICMFKPIWMKRMKVER